MAELDVFTVCALKLRTAGVIVNGDVPMPERFTTCGELYASSTT